MEVIEENQEVMRQEIDQLNGKLDRMMETLQGIANREQNPQPPVVENTTPEPQPTPAAVVVWPPFGLPQGYTPPQLENPTESGPSQPRPLKHQYLVQMELMWYKRMLIWLMGFQFPKVQ
jgi:hypothetical protein